MYTRPGQQADDEMRRELQREPHCAEQVCGHIIWTHNFMAAYPHERTCSVADCKCPQWKCSQSFAVNQ